MRSSRILRWRVSRTPRCRRESLVASTDMRPGRAGHLRDYHARYASFTFQPPVVRGKCAFRVMGTAKPPALNGQHAPFLLCFEAGLANQFAQRVLSPGALLRIRDVSVAIDHDIKRK